MGSLFAGGWIVDLILAVMVLEGLAALAWNRRTGGGQRPVDIAANLLAGAGLLLALRAALVDAWWGWVALGLTVALVGHLADFGRRALR